MSERIFHILILVGYFAISFFGAKLLLYDDDELTKGWKLVRALIGIAFLVGTIYILGGGMGEYV